MGRSCCWKRHGSGNAIDAIVAIVVAIACVVIVIVAIVSNAGHLNEHLGVVVAVGYALCGHGLVDGQPRIAEGLRRDNNTTVAG